MPSIAVAVSGGVDSLCAAMLLKEAGHDIFALHALLAPESAVPGDLAANCAKLGIRLEIADLRQEFRERVINPSLRSLACGYTPNPCAFCNQVIKFGKLLEIAESLGADQLATGHYVNPGRLADGSPVLRPAADRSKDQAYFLSLVPGKQLGRAIFPLAGQIKSRTRQIVTDAGFGFERESQDVCFRMAPEQSGELPGPILLAADPARDSGKFAQIGRHQGLGRYTLGQRKGLGVPWSEPLFVCARDYERNALIVAPGARIRMTGVRVDNLNYFVARENWAQPLYARLRYRQKPCRIMVQQEGSGLYIKLLEQTQPTAPGQIAAIYDENGQLLAGGVVDEVMFADPCKLP